VEDLGRFVLRGANPDSDLKKTHRKGGLQVLREKDVVGTVNVGWPRPLPELPSRPTQRFQCTGPVRRTHPHFGGDTSPPAELETTAKAL
jgi:hypothetical protein